MSPEQVAGIYMGLGVLMATAACIIQVKTDGCPSRGQAITEFYLWAVLGPCGAAVAILFSPIWLPIVLMSAAYDAWDGSRYERAISAWLAKPLCKPRR